MVFIDEEHEELKQIDFKLNETFENNKIQEYETLLELKKVFKYEKRFAKFVIQTSLKMKY